MPAPITKVLLVVTLAISAWYFGVYGKESYTFYGDAMGYYMYLPSTFIYHNHKALDWLPADKHLEKPIRRYITTLADRTPKGYLIDRYTYGIAAMEMPFFFAAHAYEKIRGKEANGYSVAYKNMIKISSMFYALLGLFVLYRVLKLFFSEELALLGTLIVFLGTNLFWFTLYQAGMAHVPLFFLYSLLIYLTVLLHRQPQTYLFIATGFVAGLITIIRPVDILCLLIPILYNLYNRETAKRKWALITANYKNIVWSAIAFVIPLIPQMIYWKKFAGSYIYYSYTGEGFTWLQPHIFTGLFSFTNGWLIYSPVMIFSVIGILLYKRIRPVSVVFFVFVPIYVYIIYCWSCYIYINGLGSRPMIHLYPLLAFPLVAFIVWVSAKKFYWKFIVSLLFVFFITLNITYSIQQAKNILLSEESNSVYNLHMLFKTAATYNDLVMYDVKEVQPLPGKIEKIATLACENFNDSASGHFMRDVSSKSGFAYRMAASEEYPPKTIVIDYSKAIFKDAVWMKCSGWFFCPQPYIYFKHMMTLEVVKDGKSVHWWGCKIDNKIGLDTIGVLESELNFNHVALNEWGYVSFFVKVPADIADGDKIRLGIWNIGKQELFIDHVCLELFKDK